VYVCAARALAHGATPVARFSDPTALALLPEAARARVERLRAAGPPESFRQRLARGPLDTRSKMMVVRTVAIDDAVRAASAPQLVILGAGLDGRAWRMQELREVTVFEVDHPDSQREKQALVGRLEKVAREVRFVPIDFTRDSLDAALAAAGHDPARATTWIWEGVVMYLAQSAIEATLDVVQKRSAPDSQLIVVYHSPARILKLVGLVLRFVGEPLRSVFSAEQLRELLARSGFDVSADSDLPTLGSALSADIAHATRHLKHMRIATARRRG
ncbi:MAG TPA: class I SAM-dependent methyltransferase, partial [Polyangiaceae bacterium]|nr:class I SAM-dependent methyltransferase [Polyangiaceae bacterium]